MGDSGNSIKIMGIIPISSSWSWGDDGKHRIPRLLVARTKRIVDANWSGSVSSVPPSIGGIFSGEGFWIKSLC